MTGDAALCHVARLINSARRGVDTAGRIGGEEFVVLFSEQTASNALSTANLLRELVAAMPLPHGDSVIAVTLSGGVATYPADGTDWDALFAVADRRLYAAKSMGRNRVEGPELLDESMQASL